MSHVIEALKRRNLTVQAPIATNRIVRPMMSTDTRGDLLRHWIWAIGVLLCVAFLSVRQIDLYPPTADEFFSMSSSGWLRDGPFSPAEILNDLRELAPNHVPGYYFLLSVWGSLTINHVALGRVLTIFTALLALAVTYRLTRDFVAPAAGLFAIIIISSNAFYNFYVVHIRMYPLLILGSALTLLFYLRIMYPANRTRLLDYAALCLAMVFLFNTHAFSATFFIMLGAFHVFLAQKNNRWRRILLAFAVSALLCTPTVSFFFQGGLSHRLAYLSGPAADSRISVETWLTLMLNHQPLLLALSLVGLALGLRNKKISFKPYHILSVFFLIALMLLASTTTWIRVNSMRYQLDGLIPFVMIIALGVQGLYQTRRWLGLLLFAWVIAGLVFQNTADFIPYVAGRTSNLRLPPIQTVSRLALQAEPTPVILFFCGDDCQLWNWKSYQDFDYSQLDHYIHRHEIPFMYAYDLSQLERGVQFNSIVEPSRWVLYQSSWVGAYTSGEIDRIMNKVGYRRCETVELGTESVIAQYAWQALNCQSMQVKAQDHTESINYEFYGTRLEPGEVRLNFIDQWTRRGDVRTDNTNMSYQLVTADWRNVAQLDLPLVHESAPRQFSIDISQVSPGTYRLMLILYDPATGERIPWEGNPGYVPEMLPLSEITISGL